MVRTTALALAGLSLLTLPACTNPVAPTAPAFQEVANDGGATSSTLPLHFIRSMDCNGEQVELTGIIHLVARPEGEGGVVGHFNYQQVTGTGLTSGVRYHASAVDHLHLQAPFPSSIQSVRSFHLIGEGLADNLLVDVLFHITVNANGEVTATIEDLTTRCV